jgi:hypothetical protein
VNTRLAFCCAALMTAVLAACGGGGGGGGGTPPTSKPTTTPTATPTPTIQPNIYGCVGVASVAQRASAQSQLVGVHPIASGNVTYNGTFSQTIARSSPCPIPSGAPDSGTVQVTVTMTPTTSPAFDEHSVETDSGTLDTQMLTTDATVESVSGTGSFTNDYLETAESTTDQSNNMLTTTYASPYMQFGGSPEASGNTWHNGPPSSVLQTLADGTILNRTYKIDGSYSETDTLPGTGGAQKNQITVNSNGSGSYVAQITNSAGVYQTTTITYAAPSGGAVDITVAQPSASPEAGAFPAWFSPSPTLYSDTFADHGQQPFATACGTMPIVGSLTAGEEIVRTETQLDPVLGYTDTRTTTTWDIQNGSTWTGPVCVQISDTMNVYYDYALDTVFAFFFSQNGQPIQVNATTETFSAQSSLTTFPAAVRRAGMSTAASRVSLAEIRAREDGMDFMRSLDRARRVESLSRFVRNGGFAAFKRRSAGGVK